MKTIEIKGTARKELGKKATRELRKKQHVPCVIYGGEEIIHFSAHENDFRHIVYTPNVYIINVDVEGKKLKAVMQDLQFHPVSDKIEHIDFYEVTDDKPLNIKIPVKLNGLAAGVQAGGKLYLLARYLKVKGLSKDLPDQLDVDVTKLELGKVIKVGELSFDNLQILENKGAVVAAVKLTRSSVSAGAGEEEGEEGAEGEAAAEGAESSDE